MKEIYEYERFVIEDIHLKLLKRSYWEYNGMCEGSIGMDVKRPYGNSDPLDDICEELNIKKVEDTYGNEIYLKEHFEKAQKIHEEMLLVLDIITKTLQVSTGVYLNENYGKKFEYSPKWRKVDKQ